MRYRSKETVEAYYRDGTPEADDAIVAAAQGAERFTDHDTGTPGLLVVGVMGLRKMQVGWWLFRTGTNSWSITPDRMFRNQYEVIEDTAPPPDETFNAVTDWRDPVPGWETETLKTVGSAIITRHYTYPSA